LGGLGLPKNTADLQERDGKIVQSALTGTIDELLTTIEKNDTPELKRLTESSATWKLDSNVTKRSGEITRLRAVVAAGSFESRLLAVRALGRVRELDNVPVLIYALSDPDMRVVREADKGLRFISRKFDGVGLPDEPKPEQAQAAIKSWKNWILSVRPNVEFLD
jgi:HEAT repeat protein